MWTGNVKHFYFVKLDRMSPWTNCVVTLNLLPRQNMKNSTHFLQAQVQSAVLLPAISSEEVRTFCFSTTQSKSKLELVIAVEPYVCYVPSGFPLCFSHL